MILGRSIRTGKRGHYERGLFTGGIESLKSLDSLESVENGRFILCFSTISRISKFSGISRKGIDCSEKTPFSKRPLVPNPRVRVGAGQMGSDAKGWDGFSRILALSGYALDLSENTWFQGFSTGLNWIL